MVEIIGGAPRISGFAGHANQIITGSIQEDLFVQGKSFSYVDYLTYGILETKTFVVDPLQCDCNQVVFNPIFFSGNAGPVLIDYFAGGDFDDDGVELGVSNRRGTSDIINKVILRANPTINNIGTRFSGDLIAANEAQGSGNSSQGADSSKGLPFEIKKDIKYAFQVTNMDGAGVYIKIDTTWFEF